MSTSFSPDVFDTELVDEEVCQLVEGFIGLVYVCDELSNHHRAVSSFSENPQHRARKRTSKPNKNVSTERVYGVAKILAIVVIRKVPPRPSIRLLHLRPLRPRSLRTRPLRPHPRCFFAPNAGHSRTRQSRRGESHEGPKRSFCGYDMRRCEGR
ncbi:hypothetical protein FA95DRAFT_124880 [Auriscalpium vulgare]|uniref:Uncharacterized protein n=1 Tax=Auriscalpium vulgare TaxID=40419 RepID=A0ACB8RNQ3_9AGAM|nr:hypothetical protein FA95DRAFT_124880 [Auriscalpium vulgare]